MLTRHLDRWAAHRQINKVKLSETNLNMKCSFNGKNIIQSKVFVFLIYV